MFLRVRMYEAREEFNSRIECMGIVSEVLNVWLYVESVAVCYVMPTTSPLQPAAIPSPGGWQGWWNVVIQEATGGVQQEVTQGHKAADKGTLGGAFQDTTTTTKCGTHRSVGH